MAEITYKTKGDVSPKEKPRIFFTCHHKDFSKYFEVTCQDLFRAADCAVYYTPDMREPLTEENLSVDLERMQLLVIPVTYDLLTTENRTITQDLPYAVAHSIPILPLVMSPGLDMLYGRENYFGKRQYLEPNCTDDTQIPYREKLRLFLEGLLLNDKLLQRIRNTFSAYMFLSYRKKDRHHANTLMRLIHNMEAFRDIAIWFDEFLVPGENFDTGIAENMAASKLFALLVTPNLAEKPNYVMTCEYLEACLRENYPILPFAMEQTNLEELAAAYPDVPKRISQCIDPKDTANFHRSLLEALHQTDIAPISHTPETEYLIGMAYMEGVNMETDRKRGLELIRSAAEKDHPEAINELCRRYQDGIGVPFDLEEAVYWARKRYLLFLELAGAETQETLVALNELARLLLQQGKYNEALPEFQKAYDAACCLYDADDPQIQHHQSNLATCHRMVGNYDIALAKMTQVHDYYKARKQIPPAEILGSLSTTYEALGQYEKALELALRAYEASCDTYGSLNPTTLRVRENLAMIYMDTGDTETAIKILKEIRAQRENDLPKDHPDILTAISHLGRVYSVAGAYHDALEMAQLAYDKRLAILREKHPDTLTSLNNLAMAHKNLCHFREALELSQRETALCRALLGEDHPDTLISQHNLAAIHIELAHFDAARELLSKTYELRRKTLTDKHPATISILASLAGLEETLGNYTQARNLFKEAKALSADRYGAQHPNTLLYDLDIAQTYTSDGQNYETADRILTLLEQKIRQTKSISPATLINIWNSRACNLLYWEKRQEAITLSKQVYQFCFDNYGHDSVPTLCALGNLARIQCNLGTYYKIKGDKTTATKYFNDALNNHQKGYLLSCKRLGERHPDTIDRLNAWAVAIGEKGDYDKAIPKMTEVWRLRCEVLGAHHLDTLQSLSNLSGMQAYRSKKGKRQRSLDKDIQVYEGYLAVLGKEHPTTLKAMEDVATTLFLMGQFGETLVWDEKIYEQWNKRDPLHPQTLTSLIRMINSHRELDNTDALCNLLPVAIALNTQFHGPLDANTLHMRFDLAVFTFQNGDRETGLEMMQQLFVDCKQQLPFMDPFTEKVRMRLMRMGGNPKL